MTPAKRDVPSVAERFAPDATREILVAACASARLDPESAELIRLGENALYRLATDPVMVRIGRSLSASRKEVAVAEWLSDEGYPGARLVRVDQPVIIEGLPVTFWRFIEQSPEPVTSRDLGRMLRRLHNLEVPGDLELPQFEPMPKVDDRLANYGAALLRTDLDFMNERKAELEEKFLGLDFALDTGPVHGDAHEANLLRDTDGVVRLIDFEDFCYGPREWDVCVEAVRYRAFGWTTDADYRQFVDAYGFDPLEWSGFDVMRATRELNMTTWLLQLIGQSDDVDEEIHRRIADLRDEQALRYWRVF